ncbi:MAG: dephospho-CoA kinase [Elusimicrobiota bacterium]
MNKEMKQLCRRFKTIKGKTIVGLTGAAASGKSSALECFKKLGAFCVSTDGLAKEVLTSRACYNKISRKFGSGVFLKDGSIDRKKLAKEIFSDKSKRKRLESILHPEILKHALALIKTSNDNVIILEAPLLFEAGLEQCFALTICVDAPYRLRLKRAAERGWTSGEFRRRSAAQFTAGEKAARADIVIGNAGTVSALRAKIVWVFDFLNKLEKK